MMMETSEKRPRYDGADGLYGPSYWRILVQSEVGPHRIMILLVGTKDIAQMSFTEDDDMVETFASDRTDQAFSISILPG
jgi:hypothetical protein